jgi:hypothetical protein
MGIGVRCMRTFPLLHLVVYVDLCCITNKTHIVSERYSHVVKFQLFYGLILSILFWESRGFIPGE